MGSFLNGTHPLHSRDSGSITYLVWELVDRGLLALVIQVRFGSLKLHKISISSFCHKCKHKNLKNPAFLCPYTLSQCLALACWLISFPIGCKLLEGRVACNLPLHLQYRPLHLANMQWILIQWKYVFKLWCWKCLKDAFEPSWLTCAGERCGHSRLFSWVWLSCKGHILKFHLNLPILHIQSMMLESWHTVRDFCCCCCFWQLCCLSTWFSINCSNL